VKHVLLNNIEHRDLRIANFPSVQFGDNVNFALLVPTELKAAQHFYPIFIQKDSTTGQFFFSALLGFQEGENLFLEDSGWTVDYIPLSVLRLPFLIGHQSYVEGGEKKLKRVINLDVDSARINHPQGMRVFDEEGKSTEYLNSVADVLENLHVGLIEADQLIARLVEYNLLEVFTLKITFNDHKKYEIPDMYTINEDVLRSLPDSQVVALHRDGTLERIYSILHSQMRVRDLIRLKNIQDAA
jgi:hypothetical protein